MRGALAMIALVAGCRVSGEFHCESSAQCVGQGGQIGVCLAGSCALGDTSCASGWRYDESAAEDLAGSCLEGNAPADCATWTPHYFSPCSLPAPLGDLHLSTNGYVYDTDHGEFIGGPPLPHTSIVLPQDDGTATRIISAASFTLDTQIRLRVIGTMPLVIASWGRIDVNGRIDTNSSADDVRGAGANAAACPAASAGDPGVQSKGSGGGGGGGFAGAGGAGGDADNDNAPARVGGRAGAQLAMPAAHVHGGCPGGNGGMLGPGVTAPLSPATSAAGGAGGGAIQLSARSAIAVTGLIEAGGAGGAGGPANSEGGGGGGGSGGFVGLDAPMVSVTGILAANGGAGGGGASDTTGGGTGGDGRAAATAASAGSAGGTCAGAGGSGAGGSTLGGGEAPHGLATCGGGGGGGGAGVIAIHSAAFTMTGATISPSATVAPN